MITPDPHLTGERIAEYPHPRRAQRWLTAWLLRAGMAADLVAIGGMLLLGLIEGLPLTPLIVLVLAGLLLPLVQLAIMHPAITVYERGLWLHPLIGSGCWIAWDALARIEPHTLIRRGTTRPRQREHHGQLIVVTEGLPRVYTLIGGMSGLGWRVRAFGISTHSHARYGALLKTIQQHVETRSIGC